MAERLFQIGIKAVVTNNEDKILLLSLLNREGKTVWDIPGGRMDDNEDFLDTLTRELREEIDCDYEGEPELLATTLSKHTVKAGDIEAGLVIVAYRVELPKDAVITLNDYETGYEWCTREEAAKRLIHKYSDEFIEATIK